MNAMCGVWAGRQVGRWAVQVFSLPVLAVLLLSSAARADTNANAIVNLSGVPTAFNGANVIIGQLEIGTPTNTVTDFNAANVLGSFNYPSGSGPDNHATQVASTMISTGAITRGTAPGAQLYSVGAATTPDFISGMWLLATQQNVSVINISAGISSVTGFVSRATMAGGTNYVSAVRVSNANGQDATSLSEDNLVQTKGVTMVLAAGNDGRLGANTEDLEASAYNIISVGAVSNNTAGTTQLADFSSKGYLSNGRAGIDIVAPGADIVMNGFNTNSTLTRQVTVIYSNNTGGTTVYQVGTTFNTSGPGAPQTPLSRINTNSGTSFAAPIVAGVAADLISAAKSGTGVFSSSGVSADAQDSRIVKAVLLNSATKLAGWTQTSFTLGGTTFITQPLDANQGAGLLNAGGAYNQLAAGEFGATVHGNGPAGALDPLKGWALEGVNLSLTNVYRFASPAGGQLTATLDWLRHTGPAPGFADQGLTDLDLYLWSSPNAAFTNVSLVAASISTVDNVEQIYLTNLPTAYYEVGVQFFGQGTSTLGANSENYGLAWNITVPEPSTLLLAGLGLAVLGWVRRRKT